MSRQVDWGSVREAADGQLRDGEVIERLLPAIVPTTGRGGGQAIAVTIPLIMAVERWQRSSEVRSVAGQSNFPLAARMIIVMTDQRLLIWSARRSWQLDRYLGDVARGRVVHAETPTIGTGWRTVAIHLSNEPTISLKVPAPIVEDFAAALSGRSA